MEGSSAPTDLEGWREEALRWRAEAAALRDHNERLSQSAHAFLASSQRMLEAAQAKTCALESSAASLVLATRWPRRFSQISVEWLGALTGAEVAGFDTVPFSPPPRALVAAQS